MLNPRNLLLVQVDGLSAPRLDRAMSEGWMPNLARWCAGEADLQARTSTTPPSTPVFQSSLLYARTTSTPVVHGYAWFDRKSGRVCRCDVPEDLAHIEAQLSGEASTSPLLARVGAASYCITFLGGCGRALLTLANGMLPSGGWRTERLMASLLRGLLRLPGELADATRDMFRFVRAHRTMRFEWNWLAMRVLNAVAFEELSTTGALLDLARGAPIIYINYIAYDEAAHRRGPDHDVCFEQLRRIDGHIGRLLDAGRKHGYDVVLFSDHGQAVAQPFDVATGRWLEGSVMAACAPREVDDQFDALSDRLCEARTRSARMRKWPGPLGTIGSARAAVAARRTARKLEHGYHVPAGELAVVTGGSVAHVYVGRHESGSPLEEIRARFPKLLPALLASPAIGLVVARRSAGGPIVFHRGEAASLNDDRALEAFGPFRRAGAAKLANVIRRITSSETAGDLVLYGAFAEVGDVSFDPELGSHGGVHPDELRLFVARPKLVQIPDGDMLDPVELGKMLRARWA